MFSKRPQREKGNNRTEPKVLGKHRAKQIEKEESQTTQKKGNRERSFQKSKEARVKSKLKRIR